MKILHINPSLTGGGIKTFICSLANTQNELGHEVHICTIYSPKNDNWIYSNISPNIKVHHLGKTKQGFSIKELFSVIHFIRSGKFDIVNIHGYMYYYILAILFLHKHVRFFYTVHNDAYHENSHWDKRILPIKKFYFKKEWVHPITISAASQTSFNKLYNCRNTLIVNGISSPNIVVSDFLSSYKVSPQTLTFIHVGRITEAKNQIMLCRIFSQLVAEGCDITLIIVGQIQDQQIYNEIIPFLSERINYLGERSDSIQLMAESDAFCLPSLWEGMPLTVLEALAVGCPPICTPAGGVVDIVINETNGFITSDFSEEQYKQAIKNYINLSSQQRIAMCDRCKQSFIPYDITNTAKEYINTYQSNIMK